MGYLAVIAGILLGDGWIKSRVERDFKVNERRPVAKGRIVLTRHQNRGGVMNCLQERPKIILCAACIALAYVVLLLGQALSRGEGRLAKLGLSMIFGGGLCNLLDRVRKGYVVDYFTIRLGKLRKVIFNLSDICIFAGSLLALCGAALSLEGAPGKPGR